MASVRLASRAVLAASRSRGISRGSPEHSGAPLRHAIEVATYIDPAAHIINGYAVIIGAPSFIAPYSTLDAHGGIIKIGSGTDILDNATIVANPPHAHTAPAPEVLIGDHVLVSYRAQILGPSTIGAYGTSVKPTGIGPGAVIDQAIIEPGAIISALARVGPGVTVPSGYRILPGKNITTNAEASDPSLGKVVAVTNSDLNDLGNKLAANQSLAQGYNTLYQGQSATGANPGVDPSITGISNGNLSTVEGAGSQPGSPTATTAFLPPGTGPRFPSPNRGLITELLYNFRARVTGGAVFRRGPGTSSTTWDGATRSAPIWASRSPSPRSARAVTGSRSTLQRAARSPSARTSWRATAQRSWATAALPRLSSVTTSRSAMEPWFPARRWATARQSAIARTWSTRRSRQERRFRRERSTITTRWSGSSSGESESQPAGQRPGDLMALETAC